MIADKIHSYLLQRFIGLENTDADYEKREADEEIEEGSKNDEVPSTTNIFTMSNVSSSWTSLSTLPQGLHQSQNPIQQGSSETDDLMIIDEPHYLTPDEQSNGML